MAEADFLITLPSNSNMDTNPDNEQSNFTVKLAEPLHLEGDWEAALVSVQYTPNWLSFDKAQHLVAVYFMGELGISKPTIYRSSVHQYILQFSSATLEEIYSQVLLKSTVIRQLDAAYADEYSTVKVGKLTLQPKYYESVEALGNEIVKLITEAFTDVSLNLRYIYDHGLKRGEFYVKRGEILILTEGSTVLANLLGQYTTPDSNVQATWYALANHGVEEPKLQKVSSLWVYTDITQYQQVGNAKVPLIGIIPTQTDGAKRVHYTVNPVNFVALKRNNISEITVKIVDDRGKRIPFVKGDNEDNLVCCLRFRRRKSNRPI